ncbi:hypothetical protein EXN66_Car006639 [Channa argus]|uniref:Uncharacterized protein n=1 Tax=Channa argus TaxID=215402 RepID=A0A6G1PL04_CHAAH|nr:hypothetical protein EXN66_Car006639 [Channa argus]
MDAIGQKVQLISGAMNQECVGILLRMVAAGSVRVESSSPHMLHDFPDGNLVAVWLFVCYFFAFHRRTLANVGSAEAHF